MNRDSSSSASTSSSLGIARYAVCRSMNSRSGSWAAGSSSAKPERSSRTSSPPFDHTNGAILISDGSTPSPYCPRSRSVSFTAVSTNCFHVQLAAREREAGLPEERLVVVDDEARDVLGQAAELALEAERVERLRVEVVLLEGIRLGQSLLDRLELALGGELAVEAVIEEEEVRRPAARDRGREPGEQVVAVAGLDELDVDVGLLGS